MNCVRIGPELQHSNYVQFAAVISRNSADMMYKCPNSARHNPGPIYGTHSTGKIVLETKAGRDKFQTKRGSYKVLKIN